MHKDQQQLSLFLGAPSLFVSRFLSILTHNVLVLLCCRSRCVEASSDNLQLLKLLLKDNFKRLQKYR